VKKGYCHCPLNDSRDRQQKGHPATKHCTSHCSELMDPPGNLGSRGKCVLVIVVVKNVLIQGDAIAECCRVLYCHWLCLRAEVEMRILLLQSPAIAEDCYILVMLFIFYLVFFSVHQIFDVPGPIFAKLCHTTRYVLK